MVKVGILTYHRSLNYGAVMQAYCLAEEIQKRFPDVSVEIVDYMSKKMNRYYKMITIYRGKESLIHLKERIEKFLLSDFRMKSLHNLVHTILPLNSKK